MMKEFKGVFDTLQDIYEAFIGGSESGRFALGGSVFYEWKNEAWVAVQYTNITTWTIPIGEWRSVNIPNPPAGLTVGTYYIISFKDMLNNIITYAYGDKLYTIKDNVATEVTVVERTYVENEATIVTASEISKIPLLRYQLEPVETISELYHKYPNGGENGWYSMITSVGVFAYWDVDTLTWEQMSDSTGNGSKWEDDVNDITDSRLYNGYCLSANITSNDRWRIATNADFDILKTGKTANDLRNLGFGEIATGIITPDGSYYELTSSAYLYGDSTPDYLRAFVINGDIISSYSLIDFKNGAAIRLIASTTTLTNGQTGTYVGNDGTQYPTICIGTQEWLAVDLKETLTRTLSQINFAVEGWGSTIAQMTYGFVSIPHIKPKENKRINADIIDGLPAPLFEIYTGETQPTENHIKIWIDTTPTNPDVEILRAIRDANPQSTALAALFDDSKDPLTEWWDEGINKGALFGGDARLPIIADNYGITLPDVLDVNRCYMLEMYGLSLTNVDVDGLTELIMFICYNNQLTSLDVSGLSALQYLDCENNQLTSLDVSGLSALQYLYCDNNQLTSLDASGLSSLQDLICYSNQLTSIDISGLSALQYLYCFHNQLTSIPTITSKGSILYYNFTYNWLPIQETDRLIALGFESQYVLPQNIAD